MPATEANTASEDALGSEDNTPSGGETLWYGGDPVVIAQFATLAEAYVLQSRLQADGVPAVVPDAHSWGDDVFVRVRVLVPESHFELAREIVSAIERGDYRLDEPSE